MLTLVVVSRFVVICLSLFSLENCYYVPRKAELERVRATANTAPEIDAADARRRDLKKLCDERVRLWPNTLQAQRQKKVCYMIQFQREKKGTCIQGTFYSSLSVVKSYMRQGAVRAGLFETPTWREHYMAKTGWKLTKVEKTGSTRSF